MPTDTRDRTTAFWTVPDPDTQRPDGDEYDDDELAYTVTTRRLPDTQAPYWVTDTIHRYLSSAGVALPGETVATCYGTSWSSLDDYSDGRRLARQAMSRLAEGAYSRSTLDSIEGDDEWTSESPVIVMVEAPIRFDTGTEMKQGGTLAVAVAWRDRIALAVTPSARRCGLGSALLKQALVFAPYAGCFVARRNVDAHHFLLEAGLHPVSVSATGVVRYSTGEEDR